MKSYLFAVAALVSSCAGVAVAEDVSFVKQIAPILAKQCVGCHGTRDFKGGYQLHTFEALLRPGDSGDPPIVPGKPDESYCFDLLLRTDPGDRMPKNADALPAAGIDLFKRWIAAGAKYDGGDPKALLQSIIPKVPHPQAPAAYRTAFPVTALAFLPGGKELVSSGYHELLVWNAEDGKLLRRFGNVAERTYALDVHPKRPWIAAASGTPGVVGEIRLYDAHDGKLLREYATLTDAAFGVAFSPDGTRLAACGADRTVRVFEVDGGKEMLRIEDHADWVLDVTWSADGKRLGSASRDKTAKLFDAATGESEITYPGHNEIVHSILFHPDGKQILTAGGDRNIHIWAGADAKKAHAIGGYAKDVYRIRLVGEQIWSVSGDKTARIHRLNERNQLFSMGGHGDWVLALAASSDGKTLAGGTFDGMIHLWNAAEGKEIRKWKAAPGANP